MNISEQELEIFSRHLILKEFDEAAFKKLQKKKITLIGLGGIGCPAIQYLVSTGVKNIKLIDGDIVQKNNLNRQLLFSINDIKKSKAVVAKERLKNINPERSNRQKNVASLGIKFQMLLLITFNDILTQYIFSFKENLWQVIFGTLVPNY